MEEQLMSCLRHALEVEDQAIALSDNFRDYPTWDSLARLSLIAGLDDSFGVAIESDDFNRLVTVQDLLNEIGKRRTK